MLNLLKTAATPGWGYDEKREQETGGFASCRVNKALTGQWLWNRSQVEKVNGRKVVISNHGHL